jgi:hypothetical protein
MAITRLEGKVRAVGRGKIPAVAIHASVVQNARALEIEVKERDEQGPISGLVPIVNLLPRCTRLNTLTLNFALSSAELLMLGHAIDKCPSLETVDLTGCTGFSEEAVHHFLRHCSHIQDLRLPDLNPAWG